MFIAALFIIARTWKQPRCPSADEWIRKLWYIFTVEYYSAIKKNSFESVLMRWMKLEPIIQSEVIQKDKDQYSILTHIYGIQKDGNNNPICNTVLTLDILLYSGKTINTYSVVKQGTEKYYLIEHFLFELSSVQSFSHVQLFELLNIKFTLADVKVFIIHAILCFKRKAEK